MVELLLTGAFGLVAGLGGVSLQAHLQRREKESDRQHEKRKLLLAKVEEVFLEADRTEERSSAAHMQALEHLHGVNNGAPNLSLMPNERIKSLLRSYFPESEALIQKHQLVFHQIFQNQAAKNEAADQAPDLPTKAKLMREARCEAAEKAAHAMLAMMNDVRSFMQQQVKTLL